MNNLSETFRPQRSTPVRVQIAAHVRQQIQQGTWEPGYKLPPTQELALNWQTQPAVVQAAMAILVKEGLIERKPHHGTFVCESVASLTRAGIYVHGEVWGRPNSSFYTCLTELLSQGLRDQNIQPDVWLDQRAGRNQTVWSDLVQAAQRREIQGLIVTAASREQIAWLKKLPIPVTFLTKQKLPNRVHDGLLDFLPTVMQDVVARGHRSIALISTMPRHEDEPDDTDNEYSDFYNGFMQIAQQHGLTVSHEWNQVPVHGLLEKEAEPFGYKAFQQLWSQPTHPDSLLVFTDLAARGVLWAALQQRVRVPQDLHLILHRNAEIGLFCPLPASYMELSIKDVAQAMIEQLRSIYRGQEAKTVTVNLQLVK